MSETSRPWQSTTPGDAGPYSASQWQILQQYFGGFGANRANVGVLLGTGTQPNSALKVQAQGTPSASVDVLAGAALVQGILYINTATNALAIAANSSGNPRIDTIILRADYALQTVRLAVLQGTPAASPSAPSLTQSANIMWEIPLADIAVANGFTSITNANITPRAEPANAASGVYLDNILNNSGSELNTGDVVIWDISADRAIKTTTTLGDSLLAGVWQGRTANGEYGRVLVDGVGYVNGGAAITRGDKLITNSVAKQAITNSLYALNTDLGIALETTSGSGLILAYVKVRSPFRQGYQPAAFPASWNPTLAYSGNTTLPAVSGSVLIPIQITGPMLLQSVQILNNDTATARTWRWDLYADLDNNANALPRVATCSAPETFTPGGAASVRTIAAANAPVYLAPGNYYLVIQNTHATNTFALGAMAVGSTFNPTTAKTKTTGGTNGATLDIVAATWTGIAGSQAVSLRGRAAGDTVAW